MRSLISLCVLTAILPIFGTTIATHDPLTGQDVENTYIVKCKDGVPLGELVSALKSGLTHPGSGIKQELGTINAVVVTVNPLEISFIRGLSGMEYMERDRVVSISFNQEPHGPRAASLAKRESCPQPPFEEDGGKGVTIYSIGTGVQTEHECFGGRAKWGKVFGGYNMTDDHGHGTHTTGIAAGNYYGVARGASIVAIKVLGKSGSGAMTDAVSGINYACEEFQKSNFTSSITTIPFTSAGIFRPLDDMVNTCAKKGMHFTVSAGYENRNASSYSPARVAIANTVGAVDSTCGKAQQSNFGPIVDVHALGINVTSAGIGPSNNETKMASGASISTSYVAGILAVVLEKYGQKSPEELTAILKSNAYRGAFGFSNDTTTDVAQLW